MFHLDCRKTKVGYECFGEVDFNLGSSSSTPKAEVSCSPCVGVSWAVGETCKPATVDEVQPVEKTEDTEEVEKVEKADPVPEEDAKLY